MRFINFDEVFPDPLAEIQVNGKKYKVMPKNSAGVKRLYELQYAALDAEKEEEKEKIIDKILDEFADSIEGLNKKEMMELFNSNHYTLLYLIHFDQYDYGDTPQGNLKRQQKTLPKSESSKKGKKKKK